MTQTVERRPLTRPAPPARRSSPSVLLPGATAAGWALGAGLVALGLPVLLAWAADSRSGSGAAAALRTVGRLWLVAHGTALTVPGGVVDLTPLGLTALPLLLLHRAGRHSARTVPLPGLRQAAALVATIAFPYGVSAAVLAALVADDAVRPAPVQALLGGLAVAAVGAGSGVLRESRLFTAARGLPDRVRRLAVAATAAVGLAVAGGALLAGVSVVLHAGRVTSLASASDPGLVGGVALLLLGVLLVPNAAVWGSAWVAGPGFAVGVGTSVGPWTTTLGPVPAFPLLGALPAADTPAWVAVVALLVPVAAGVVAGLLVARRLPVLGLGRAALEGALVGPCAGAAMALLAYLSGGPLGDGRLADVGPSPWRVGVAVALEVALPAAVTTAVAARRRT